MVQRDWEMVGSVHAGRGVAVPQLVALLIDGVEWHVGDKCGGPEDSLFSFAVGVVNSVETGRREVVLVTVEPPVGVRRLEGFY